MSLRWKWSDSEMMKWTIRVAKQYQPTKFLKTYFANLEPSHIKFLWFSWFLFVCICMVMCGWMYVYRTALLQRCGFCWASTLSKLREATFDMVAVYVNSCVNQQQHK